MKRILCLFGLHDWTHWRYFGRLGMKRRNCRRHCGAAQMVETQTKDHRLWS